MKRQPDFTGFIVRIKKGLAKIVFVPTHGGPPFAEELPVKEFRRIGALEGQTFGADLSDDDFAIVRFPVNEIPEQLQKLKDIAHTLEETLCK